MLDIKITNAASDTSKTPHVIRCSTAQVLVYDKILVRKHRTEY